MVLAERSLAREKVRQGGEVEVERSLLGPFLPLRHQRPYGAPIREVSAALCNIIGCGGSEVERSRRTAAENPASPAKYSAKVPKMDVLIDEAETGAEAVGTARGVLQGEVAPNFTSPGTDPQKPG